MQRLEQTFEADVASFEQSFPPLCENCAPRVDEIIKKKDYDAQINAWRMFLSSGNPATASAEAVRERGCQSAFRRGLSVAWGILVLSYLPYRCFTSEWAGSPLSMRMINVDVLESIFFSYLNILYIISLLLTLRFDPLLDLSPRWGNLADKAKVSSWLSASQCQ